jgi:diketogulonate reductase-like aldo/keto reductase
MSEQLLTRKEFIRLTGQTTAGLLIYPYTITIETAQVLRSIPSTGEKIPAIGLGSWLTFDISNNEDDLSARRDVLKTFYALGGRVVDSSPMYARSEAVIGRLAAELNLTDKLWFATKVWTNGESEGKRQIEDSIRYFKKAPNLFQVHNLLDYSTQIKTIRKMKEEGKIKYVGVTHYLNSAHADLEKLIENDKPDFIQINFSIRNRAVEDRLLPLAADKGVAVIINRPFETGAMFDSVGNAPLPEWAKDWGIKTWASYFLKYIISNPAVTCTIPATRRVDHLKENMAAILEPLPDTATRKKMVEYYLKNSK